MSRVRLIGQQQVGAHDLDAGPGGHGEQPGLAAHGLAVDAEGLGDGGAGDVGVQDAHLMAPAAHGDRQLAGDHGLAHAALAGHDAVHLADVGVRVVLLQKGLGLLPFAAALAAGGAVMGTLAHCSISFFRLRVIRRFSAGSPPAHFISYTLPAALVNRWTKTSPSPAKKSASRLWQVKSRICRSPAASFK